MSAATRAFIFPGQGSQRVGMGRDLAGAFGAARAVFDEIDEALERIEDASYSNCMECDEPISAKRLEAIAWARYCVTCQEELAVLEEEDKESVR